MFCPNCAVKNDDDVKFCRGCGQDISLVSRSLKEHPSVVLAGQIDKLFDRRHEGLLIFAILWLFTGIVMFLVAWLLVFGRSTYGFAFWLTLSVGYIFLGIWQIIRYRQILSLSTNPSTINQSQNILYCPVCGELTEKENEFCSKCGEDLEVLKQAMTPDDTGWFARRYRKALRREIEPIGTEWSLFSIAVGIFFVFGSLFNPIFFGLSKFFDERPNIFFLDDESWLYGLTIPSSIVGFQLGCTFIISGWRNLVAEKRMASELQAEETNLEAETAKLDVETQKQLTPINAQDEISQINEVETQKDLHELKIAEPETKPLSQTKI